MSKSLLVWDRPENDIEFSGSVIRWNTFNETDSVFSLPRYLELNADKLRAKYLKFIAEIGDKKIHGHTVLEHLDLGSGFSYWWMTSLVEKSPFRSASLYQCLLVLALEEFIIEQGSNSLLYAGDDEKVAETIKGICENLRIPFYWDPPIQNKKPLPLKKTINYAQSMLNRLKNAFTFFIMVVKACTFSKPEWSGPPTSAIIFSYFCHLNNVECAKGRFYSYQWTVLPALLTKMGWSVNWLHHYIKAENMNVSKCLEWLKLANKNPNNLDSHSLIYSYLNLSVVLKAISNWWRLRRNARQMGDVSSLFRVQDSATNLWPLIKSEWRRSTSGSLAGMNCLLAVVFDRALREMPNQTIGFYLHENQPWEVAMLAAWRKNGHGKIVSVQHTMVPFWHMYYFNNDRIYDASYLHSIPAPDFWSVNGLSQYEAYANSGYPNDKIIKLEPLRDVGGITSKSPNDRGVRVEKPNYEAPKILIVGEYDPVRMSSLMSVVEEFLLLNSQHHLTLKPHPACAALTLQNPSFVMSEIFEPLAECLHKFDIVIAGNSTTAALDAYMEGLHVIIYHDGKGFNLSPLRGNPNVTFFSNAKELLIQLDLLKHTTLEEVEHEEFFFSDSSLPRWSDLLGSLANSAKDKEIATSMSK